MEIVTIIRSITLMGISGVLISKSDTVTSNVIGFAGFLIGFVDYAIAVNLQL